MAGSKLSHRWYNQNWDLGYLELRTFKDICMFSCHSVNKKSPCERQKKPSDQRQDKTKPNAVGE